MRQPQLRHIAKLLLALAVAVAAAYLSDRYRFVSDWTRGADHTLSTASQSMLEQLPNEIKVTAYLPAGHAAAGQFHRLVAMYARHHDNVVDQLVDPASAPQQVRADSIRDGEIVIEYDGRSERVQKYTEQAFTAALARIARNEQRWLVFISGHGERSPTRGANHDISDFAKVLAARGMKIQELNLSEAGVLPDNTAVAVVAAPQLAYLPNELAVLERYLTTGGSLLWLSEPEEPMMERLAAAVAVTKLPGTLVDPASLASGLDNPAILVTTRYSSHPALTDFNLTTLLVYAASFVARPATEWGVTKLILSNDKAWAETDKLEGNVAFDEEQDYAGPLPLALALERSVNGREQRIVVAGDGDFLSNTYLQNGGNQELGVRLFEWLVSDDSMITVPSRVALDTSLDLERWQQAVIGFGFLIVLPAALALNGFRIWSRRRRG